MTGDGKTPRPPARRSRAPRRRRRRELTWGERGALLFTGAVKLVGLLIAANEAFLVAHRDPVAFALAAFMMAGATGLDNFLSNVFGGGRE